MTDHVAFEARLDAGYQRFLEGAPVNIDPGAAVTRLVAAGARPGARPGARLGPRTIWRPKARMRPAIAVVLALVIVGAAIAAGGFRLFQESTLPPPSTQPSATQPNETSIPTGSPDPTPTEDAFGPIQGHIYLRGQDFTFRSNPDGTWTPLGIEGSCATLSPDNRLLAYATVHEGQNALAVADPDGRNERILWTGRTTENWSRVIRWLPDGQSFAGTGLRDDTGRHVHLVIAQIDGSPATYVPVGDTSRGRAYFPSFFPDGTRMVVAVGRAETDDDRIEIRSIDGETLRVIETPGSLWDAELSPQGDLIAYTAASQDQAPMSLHVVRPNGTDDIVLAKGDATPSFRNLAWSPDGSRIAVSDFDMDDDFRSSIEVFERDGTHVATLGDFFGGDLTPSWSPDGRTIVLGNGGDQTPYLLGLDGQERALPPPGGYSEHCPLAWGPA